MREEKYDEFKTWFNSFSNGDEIVSSKAVHKKIGTVPTLKLVFLVLERKGNVCIYRNIYQKIYKIVKLKDISRPLKVE